jgi:hypothetical protein
MVQIDPFLGGKSAGPVGARVTYPLEHPRGVALPVTVEVWSSDGEASALGIAVRPEAGLAWGAGERSVRFPGPIPQNERRRHQFSVIPQADGPVYIAVDVSRERGSDVASRSFSILVKGGGRLEGAEVPGASGKAKPSP